MTTKHTPGPWEVREEDGEYRVHAADSISHGFKVQMRIAEDVGGYRKQLDDGSWSDAEIIANASLIAAAPELLGLAREIADNVILAGMEIGQRARDLIAKATGEQV